VVERARIPSSRLRVETVAVLGDLDMAAAAAVNFSSARHASTTGLHARICACAIDRGPSDTEVLGGGIQVVHASSRFIPFTPSDQVVLGVPTILTLEHCLISLLCRCHGLAV
jgi:hypothetical protein